jgi:hypothetical protein
MRQSLKEIYISSQLLHLTCLLCRKSLTIYALAGLYVRFDLLPANRASVMENEKRERSARVKNDSKRLAQKRQGANYCSYRAMASRWK